jgi:ABC-type oligopeptide transport system substrate-binding subunit
MADYPDPENFLFLLSGPMARSKSGGPNNANFQNEKYDQLFQKMAYLGNTEERRQVIHEMRSILERERPWIELFHPESYALGHGWIKNVRPTGISTIPAAKYYELDPKKRAQARAKWNEPVLWPAFVLVLVVLLILAPGVLTYYKERT